MTTPAARPRPARAAVVGVTAALILGGGLTTATASRADDTCTVRWTGGSGTWSDAAHWSTGQLPGAADDACIVRDPNGAAFTVRVSAGVGVAGLTLTGATLRLDPGVTVSAPQVAASGASVVGGTLEGPTNGILALTDTRLAGVHVLARAGLRLTGQVVVSGGTAVDATGEVGGPTFDDGLTVVDADGNAANRITVQRFPLYLTGAVSIGVRLGLADAALLAQGTVRLAALDNLDARGRLTPLPGSATVQLGSSSTGSLVLPRGITSIAAGASVNAGGLSTAAGDDALTGLSTVDGTLGVYRPLGLSHPLTVGGVVDATGDLYAPAIEVARRGRLSAQGFGGATSTVTSDVTVRTGGTLAVDRVAGSLQNAGTATLSGARLGRLTLSPASTVVLALREPIVVDGPAALGGTLAVLLPAGRALPPAGTEVVLLSAPDGVTGTFTAVGTDNPRRAGVQAGYRPTYVTGTVTAPSG